LTILFLPAGALVFKDFNAKSKNWQIMKIPLFAKDMSIFQNITFIDKYSMKIG